MSLRDLSKKLSEQTDLMIEIGTDIYGYLETVISTNNIASLRLDELNATNQQILKAIEGQSQSTGDDLEEKRDQQVFTMRFLKKPRFLSNF